MSACSPASQAGPLGTSAPCATAGPSPANALTPTAAGAAPASALAPTAAHDSVRSTPAPAGVAPAPAGSPSPAPAGAARGADFELAFNDLLVSTFRSIERYEETVLRSESGLDLTIAEAHVIDAVGRAQHASPDGATITQAAEMLGVSLPTVTASVNRLVAKSMIVKSRSPRDARAVSLSLTRSGEKAYRLHALFHRRLAHALLDGLSSQERNALVSGIRKLEAFFSAPVRAETDHDEHGPTKQEV